MFDHITAVRMSSALNRSSEIQCTECSNVIKKRDGIMFVFYLALQSYQSHSQAGLPNPDPNAVRSGDGTNYVYMVQLQHNTTMALLTGYHKVVCTTSSGLGMRFNIIDWPHSQTWELHVTATTLGKKSTHQVHAYSKQTGKLMYSYTSWK